LRRIGRGALACCLVAGGWGATGNEAAVSRGGLSASAELSANTLTHDGRERRYLLDAGVSEPEGRPLLLVLHGGQGSPERIASYAGFDRVARREDVVVAYPEAVGGNWNDGREVERLASQRDDVDDVGFLSALIEHLLAAHRLDPQAVYVVGPSNGGMMTYRLVLEKAEKLAAAAAVIANLPEPLAAGHAGPVDDPVPLLIINGSADPLMPHAGGEIRFGIWGGLGRVLSTEATAAFFAERGGCEPTPRLLPVTDAAPTDGIDIVHRGFRGGAAGCVVELYVLEGGGHVWPGAPPYAPPALIGAATESVDAAELVWSFFAERAR
jgi:polyhydroxybutyrate depolymerase